MAPEILRGQVYGFPVDMWSLGVLAVELLSGSPPFESASTEVTMAR